MASGRLNKLCSSLLGGRLTITNELGDISQKHAAPENRYATFQARALGSYYNSVRNELPGICTVCFPAFSSVCSLGFPWLLLCFPRVVLGFLGFPWVFLGFPVHFLCSPVRSFGFPWFPNVFLCFPLAFLCISFGFPLVSYVSWVFHRLSVYFPRFSP